MMDDVEGGEDAAMPEGRIPDSQHAGDSPATYATRADAADDSYGGAHPVHPSEDPSPDETPTARVRATPAPTETANGDVANVRNPANSGDASTPDGGPRWRVVQPEPWPAGFTQPFAPPPAPRQTMPPTGSGLAPLVPIEGDPLAQSLRVYRTGAPMPVRRPVAPLDLPTSRTPSRHIRGDRYWISLAFLSLALALGVMLGIVIVGLISR